MARIGDPGFVRKLQEILQVKGGLALPEQIEDPIGIVVAIDAGQLLSEANSLSHLAGRLQRDLLSTLTSFTFGPVAQGVTGTDLNRELIPNVGVNQAIEMIGLKHRVGLNTLAAGDKGKVLYQLDATIQGAFPFTQEQPGRFHRGGRWLDFDQGIAQYEFILWLPAPLRFTRTGSLGSLYVHTQFTNNRAAAGAMTIEQEVELLYRLL